MRETNCNLKLEKNRVCPRADDLRAREQLKMEEVDRKIPEIRKKSPPNFADVPFTLRPQHF
jgi:hypothetical protein